jgi:hypothetical protein
MCLTSVSVFADQSAMWTCTGEFVKFSEQQPYLGEASPFSQTLYTISQNVASQFTPGQYSAFFLTASVKVNSAKKTETISGRNEKKGSFYLEISNIKSSSDIDVISDIGDGLISYKHGPIEGKNEKVKCTRE